MPRSTLERHQVWVYLAAIALGLAVGTLWPGTSGAGEALLWPVLALLLYATFLQVPLTQLRTAFKDLRFLGAVVVGNFVLIPALVWGMVQFLPSDPALRLGMILVLLVPCTDWFIVFAQLGGGSTSRAIAITPVNLILQLVLVPLFVWLMADGVAFAVDLDAMAPALLVVGLPLVAAVATQVALGGRRIGATFRAALAWFPVPLLAFVVFLVAASQVGSVVHSLNLLPLVLACVVTFLLVTSLFAKGIASAVRLPTDAARTLAFTFGTRNSFVVLPFALALPSAWGVTAIVVVMQSLIELLAMSVYTRVVPGRLFPTRDLAENEAHNT